MSLAPRVVFSSISRHTSLGTYNKSFSRLAACYRYRSCQLWTMGNCLSHPNLDVYIWLVLFASLTVNPLLLLDCSRSIGFKNGTVGQEIKFLRHRAWNFSVTLNFQLFEFLLNDIKQYINLSSSSVCAQGSVCKYLNLFQYYSVQC